MILFAALFLSAFNGINCNIIVSPHIRILGDDISDVSSSEFNLREFPRFQPESYHNHEKRPFKSYVIYDEPPYRVLREWGGYTYTPSYGRMPLPTASSKFDSKQDSLSSDYSNNKRHVRPVSVPVNSDQPVYSNIIRVLDKKFENERVQNNFYKERFPTSYDQHFYEDDPPLNNFNGYNQNIPKEPIQDHRLPDDFPKVFHPHDKPGLPAFENNRPQVNLPPPEETFFRPNANYKPENIENEDEVELIPEDELFPGKNKRVVLCSFIRLNQKKFPNNGSPCARNDDELSPKQPNYSDLPDDKLPMEHRRQNAFKKRIKRSTDIEKIKITKRAPGFGYGYDNKDSPMSFNAGFYSYRGDFYPSQGEDDYSGNYNQFYGIRKRNQRNGNRYEGNQPYSESSYKYQNGPSKGLTSFLKNGGRRYKNKTNNDEDENDDDDDNSDEEESDEDENNDNDENNNDEDSDEEEERQNKRRGNSRNNRRKNNDDSRNRKRNKYNSNNNDNDDGQYEDNRGRRKNNNRNNDSRRNNNRRYNERNNNDRNRNNYGSYSGYDGNNYNGYSNSNSYRGDRGYSNSNYFNSDGGYGNYGSTGSYGSSRGRGDRGNYGSNRGYGNSGGYGSNGGYGNSKGYGNYGGYDSGGYNDFGGYGGYNGGYGGFGASNGFSYFA